MICNTKFEKESMITLTVTGDNKAFIRLVNLITAEHKDYLVCTIVNNDEEDMKSITISYRQKKPKDDLYSKASSQDNYQPAHQTKESDAKMQKAVIDFVKTTAERLNNE